MSQVENDNYLTTTERIVKHASIYVPSCIERSFSGSMFGNDVLQNYLRVTDTRNKNNEVFEVGQNSIGSVFHLGMETALQQTIDAHDNKILAEEARSLKLSNGWTLTGTIDRTTLLTKGGDLVSEINDYKLTKVYSGKKIKEAIAKGSLYESYIMQMNAYRLLYKQNDEHNIDMYLEMFYKDANPLKGESAYEQIQIPVIDSFEDYAIAETNKLNEYLDAGEIPPECTELWIRKDMNKRVIRTRCEFYCDAKDICPHYAKSKKGHGLTSVPTITAW